MFRILALVLALALAAHADDDQPAVRGPLGLRTPGPLRELFLEITGADARPPAALELDVRWAMANTWNEEMRLVHPGPVFAFQSLDEQADSLTVRARSPWSRFLGRGFWERLSTAVEWRLTEHWGGWSDRPIEAWHGLIGSFNFEREQYPRNQIDLRMSDDGGTAFDVHGARLALGDMVLRTQLALVQGGVPLAPRSLLPRWAVAARLDLKAPVGLLSRLGGSGSPDLGLALLGTAELLPWLTAHGLVALSLWGPLNAPVLLQPRAWHTTAEISLEAALGPTTFLVEDRILSPIFPSGWERIPFHGDDGLLSSGLYAGFRSHNQISLAVRRGPFSLWMSEDYTPGSNPHSVVGWIWESNAPDIVLGLSFTRVF